MSREIEGRKELPNTSLVSRPIKSQPRCPLRAPMAPSRVSPSHAILHLCLMLRISAILCLLRFSFPYIRFSSSVISHVPVLSGFRLMVFRFRLSSRPLTFNCGWIHVHNTELLLIHISIFGSNEVVEFITFHFVHSRVRLSCNLTRLRDQTSWDRRIFGRFKDNCLVVPE